MTTSRTAATRTETAPGTSVTTRRTRRCRWTSGDRAKTRSPEREADGTEIERASKREELRRGTVLSLYHKHTNANFSPPISSPAHAYAEKHPKHK